MGLYAWLSPLQIESPSVNVSIYQSPPSNKASSSFSFSFLQQRGSLKHVFPHLESTIISYQNNTYLFA